MVTDGSLRGVCHEGSHHEKNQSLFVPERGWWLMVGLKAIFSDTTNFDFEGLSQLRSGAGRAPQPDLTKVGA